MTSKIIECRFKTADIQNSTSDYQCNLKYSKDLVMDNGDVIQIKNTFIDTQQESGGKIVISDPITCKLQYIKYFNKNQEAKDLPFKTYDFNGFGNDTYVDISNQQPEFAGQPMYLCFNSDESQGLPFEIDQLIILGGNVGIIPSGTYTINYTIPGQATPTSRTYNVPETDDSYEYVPTNVKVDGSFGLVYDKNKPFSITPSDGGTEVRIVSEHPLVGNFNFQPQIFETQISIPTGNYSPSDLATEVNRRIQSAFETNGEQGTESLNPDAGANPYADTSQFLTIERQGGEDKFLVSIGTNNDPNDIIDVASLDEMSLMVGASQMELAFDEDLQTFSWNYLHTPFFSPPAGNQPAQPVVGLVEVNPSQNTGKYFSVLSQGGIIFTSLTSTYPDGSNANFWDDILGFQLDVKPGSPDGDSNFNLLTKIIGQRPAKTITAQANVDASTIDINLFTLDQIPAPGRQITTGYMGIAALIDRNQVDWFRPSANIKNGFLSSTTDTNNILGRQILTGASNNLYSFGYYLISLQAGFKSDFFAPESKENVMAIISRYYEQNSFTSGTSDDSIVYVHNGPPTTLSSLGVKILLPDKSIAKNIGDGSAVFVELIKNPQPSN